MVPNNAFCDKAADYVARGNAKLGRGDLKGAIADLTKAIQLKPGYAEAYERRAAAKVLRNDTNEAIEDLTKERVLVLKGLHSNGRVVRHSTTRFLMILA